MPGRTFAMRLSENMHAELEARGIRYELDSVSATVRDEVSTHWTLMDQERARFPLTLAEAKALAIISPETSQGQIPGPLLAGLLTDAIALGHRYGPTFSDTYNIDEQRLLSRLIELGPSADLAVRDAYLRWHHQDKRASTPAGFSKVGLRIATS